MKVRGCLAIALVGAVCLAVGAGSAIATIGMALHPLFAALAR